MSCSLSSRRLPIVMASLAGILLCGMSARAEESAKTAYWIGLSCEPRGKSSGEEAEEARAGLVVGQVLKGGPADKAGLKERDILVSVGKTKIERLEQLSQAIAASEGRELKLTVLRDGNRRSVEVTPSKRPAHLVIAEEDEEGDDDDDDDGELKKQASRIRLGLEQLQRQAANPRPVATQPSPWGARLNSADPQVPCCRSGGHRLSLGRIACGYESDHRETRKPAGPASK